MPVVKAHSPEGVRAFYEALLGMRVAMHEDGMMMFASMTIPTTQLIVAWPSDSAVDPALLDVDVSIEVADADAVHKSTVAAGMEVVRELRDEPWGIRRFFVRDPTGQVVNIASHSG